MITSTLVFLLRGNEILLAKKKRGFGVGKWNGPGGKADGNETPVEAACRELAEEVSITLKPTDLVQRALLHFEFEGNSDWNQDVHVFVCESYSGPEPVESEEMAPKWFALDDIPFEEMWEDDPYWLPRVLDGETVEFSFYFDKKNALEECVECYGWSGE